MSENPYRFLAFILLGLIGAALKFLLDKANVKLSSRLIWGIGIVGFIIAWRHTNEYAVYIGFVLLLFSSALLVHRFRYGKSESDDKLNREQIAFCPRCGCKLDKADKYCMQCGNRIQRLVPMNDDVSRPCATLHTNFKLQILNAVISLDDSSFPHRREIRAAHDSVAAQ